MKTKSLWLAAAALLCACTPTLECGTWSFNGTVQSNPSAFPLTSAFTFNPANCGVACNCDIDAMIQMAVVFDMTDGTYLYAGSGDAARADANGWTIDRVDGSGYGWYGLLNDGVTFYSGWNSTGANGTPNTLYDRPANWPANTLFYALDVAVCFKSRDCNNRILGYYFWSWGVDSSGNAEKFIIGPAWKGLDDEFQSAIAGWNAWAPTSGTQNSGFPGQPVLPNAVAFPALTDL